MADAAVEELPEQTTDDAYDYPVEIEDAGPSAKKLRVTVPRDRITAQQDKTFGEVRGTASLPGFRPGKAPKHLVEKRFGKAMKDQVQQDLLRESYQHAVAKSELSVLGEPEFEKPESIVLPDEGDLTYSFTVELQPDVHLPTMGGLKVKKPKIEVRDEHVQQALANLRQQQGRLIPVEDRGVQADDYLIADVTLTVDGEQVAQQDDAQLVARPGRIAGVEVADFADRVAGMKAGDEKALDVEVPAEHPNPKIAAKTVQVGLKLKDVKSLELAEIDGPFLESLGFADEPELLEALREQMVERVNSDIQTAMRRQVQEYLVNNTQMELPTRLKGAQADRVVNRRAMDLMGRGVPRSQVENNLQQLRSGADIEAERELKLFFILSKLGEEHAVEVTDEEANGQIAMAAIQNGQRPESLRQRMEQDGSLANLYVQLREQKTLDKLLESADIEEVEPTAQETSEAVAAATGEASGDEDDESQDVT